MSHRGYSCGDQGPEYALCYLETFDNTHYCLDACKQSILGLFLS